MNETGISAKFPSTFPFLKSLYVDYSGSLGHDGSPMDKLLHGLPNLRVLHIDAPQSHQERYHIQGLTWAYKFPQLTDFALSIFYPASAQDVASFLSNHPNIRTLMLNAEGEEPIPNLASLFPKLEALSMPEWGKTTAEDYTELLSANPPRKVTYLKSASGFLPYNEYDCHLIPQYAPSLRCLELTPNIQDIRDENNHYRTMRTLLAPMPDLSELAIHFSSGGTNEPRYREDYYPKPLPMDEEILSKIIKALPKSSNLRLQVLRMKDLDDGKGLPLDVQSSTFASLRESIPSSLKVLQWEIDNLIVRYEFEPGQSVRIVLE